MKNHNKHMPMQDISVKSPLFEQSFEIFDQATNRLQKAFTRLEKKFDTLNKELDAKNIELKNALAEKENISRYLQNILESLTTGVVVADLDGRTTIMNQCAEKFTGHSRTRARGEKTDLLFAGRSEARSEDCFDIKTLDGALGRKIQLNNRNLEISGSTVTSSNGEAIGTVVLLRDITRILKLEETVRRSEKLAAMGETAANIAHEIRNPLGSISLFASLLKKELKEGKARERASHIINAVNDMDNKISNLLLFTRDQKPLMEKINLHNALDEIIAFSREIVEKEKIFLTLTRKDVAPLIMGNTEMLKQVFLNLILNAMQVMPEGGRLHIETRIYCADPDKSAPGPVVELRFKDTGYGISDQNIKKLFNPFFTTKEKGMGLGLAIVHNIIHIHGGSIDAENNKGPGAVFKIKFPLERDENQKNLSC
jgi:PAS domain S-box-containing protein